MVRREEMENGYGRQVFQEFEPPRGTFRGTRSAGIAKRRVRQAR